MNNKKTLYAVTTSLVLSASVMSISMSAYARPHSSYVAPIANLTAPVNNCAWWNVLCHTAYTLSYTAYSINQLSINITNNANRYNTQYPIVLVHGVSGFDDILGFEYFNGIPSALRAGNAVVYNPNLTTWESSSARGEQLLDYINNIVLPETGATKVHLIGHSQGSPTSRYVAGVSPEIVESVTSVSGANLGVGVADWVDNEIVGSNLQDEWELAGNIWGNLIDTLGGNPEYTPNILASNSDISTPGAIAFNQLFPDGEPSSLCGDGANLVNGVRYYSWGGFGTATHLLDVSDLALMALGEFASGYWKGQNHDGVIGQCDQHWGETIRDDYYMNHLDSVNMLFGLVSLIETNPKTLFKNHADRLRGMSL